MILPSFTHIVKPKLKHIYLSFDDGGNLIIKSPKVSQKQIENLLLTKASWIEKSRKKILDKKGKISNFSNASVLYYLGESYPLELKIHDTSKVSLVFTQEKFILSYGVYDEDRFTKAIDTFYKESAKAYVPEYVDIWSKTMSLFPTSIGFRKTKRQWGSCSGKNALSFNTMMMKLPPDVIQYIIVHEIAHIQHKHHQPTFWKLVHAYLPIYKEQVSKLKNFTT